MRAIPARVHQLARRARALAILVFGGALGWYLALGALAESGGMTPVVVAEDEAPLQQCRGDLAGAQAELKGQAEELAYLRQSVVIEQEACNGVRASLQQQQQDLTELAEKLAFYRGIVSPDENLSGVRIHEAAARSLGGQRYSLRLLLVQSVREGTSTAGRLDVSLTGLSGDESQSYDLMELLLDDNQTLDFDFRYYEELFAEFAVPDAVEILRVKVAVVRKGQRRPASTKTYRWKELLDTWSGGIEP